MGVEKRESNEEWKATDGRSLCEIVESGWGKSEPFHFLFSFFLFSFFLKIRTTWASMNAGCVWLCTQTKEVIWLTHKARSIRTTSGEGPQGKQSKPFSMIIFSVMVFASFKPLALSFSSDFQGRSSPSSKSQEGDTLKEDDQDRPARISRHEGSYFVFWGSFLSSPDLRPDFWHRSVTLNQESWACFSRLSIPRLVRASHPDIASCPHLSRKSRCPTRTTSTSSLQLILTRTCPSRSKAASWTAGRGGCWPTGTQTPRSTQCSSSSRASTRTRKCWLAESDNLNKEKKRKRKQRK